MKLETFLQEISIMQLLEAHPNIVKILGYTMSPPSIVMKLYPLGDLQHFLLNRSILKNKRMLLGFMQDISNGLSLIHRRGLVHCDLKLHNILLDTMGNRIVCVISDFGITNVVAGHSLLVSQFTVVNLVGLSMAYAAPECIRVFRKISRSAVNFSWDVYSLGIVIFELLEMKLAWGRH
eukprot:Partr_v1_DN27031_c1_g1_i7_m28707 putative protein kinase kinase kinase